MKFHEGKMSLEMVEGISEIDNKSISDTYVVPLGWVSSEDFATHAIFVELRYDDPEKDEVDLLFSMAYAISREEPNWFETAKIHADMTECFEEELLDDINVQKRFVNFRIIDIISLSSDKLIATC